MMMTMMLMVLTVPRHTDHSELRLAGDHCHIL